jgi:ATP-dependent DNA helicase RecG
LEPHTAARLETNLRPEILFKLFSPITGLPGIGPRNAKLVEKLAGAKIVDLVWLLPRELIDRRYSPLIAEAVPGMIATLSVRVEDHAAPPNRRQPYRVRCSDSSGQLTLVFFHARADYLEKILPVGKTRVVSGRIEQYRDDIQMTHPDHIVTPDEADSIRRVEPVYPMTASLSPKTLSRAIFAALEDLPVLPEWLDAAFLAQRQWPDWRSAVLQAHAPQDAAALEPLTPLRSRLAYDELLANQLTLAIMRAGQKRAKGRRLKGDGTLRRTVSRNLPFALTDTQKSALLEIQNDMAAPGAMLRLLQGDVGSGKTVVALIAMLNAVECGGQAAIMAPTEILARQHFATINALLEESGVRTGILTGRDKGKARQDTLDRLAAGEIDILVGTHALFQTGVNFKDLMAAVIDEQHRFGVHQRLSLAEKGRGVDVLVMTATPIPRTLTLTVYGDLEVSRLTEKPAGRLPIDTRTIPLDRLPDVVEAVGRALDQGAKVYWVCPLVEESEVSDMAAAEDRHRELSARFGDAVALVHGRMKGTEKDAAIERFAEGSARILVATTVIEVGVDVPDATVMVIEHAERFGLAQLHQLRGRIGRGEKASSCLLLFGQPLSDAARSRLRILRETEDGFRIAEEDLRLRGAGEVLGTRQSGLPEFRLADLAAHADLLAVARDDASLILDKDPDLQSPRGNALRTLLYLFERDAAIVNLRSG